MKTENSSNRGGQYGSLSVGTSKYNNINNNQENPNDFIIDAELIHYRNTSYIAEIRQQSQARNGGHISNFNIARSRRRPILRSKSESDFSLINDDVQVIRERLLQRYGTISRKSFPIKGIFKLPRKKKLTLLSIAIVDFTSFCAMAILAPFFPQEAAKKGVSTSISGIIFSIYALIVFLASPLMGKIVTHVGPKFLLITGIFLGGSTNILFALLDNVESTQLFITFCLLTRIIEATGAAAFATSSYTIVAKMFPDNIGSVLGILETFVGFGLAFGPAIGGLLYDLGGFKLPFLFLGGLMLATIPLNLYLLPSSEIEVENEGGSSGSIWKLIKNPSVIIVCLVLVVTSNTWGYLDPTLEPHLREFNLSAKQLGLFFLLSSVLYALSSPLWGLLADRINRTWIMMVVGLFFSAVGNFLIGPSPLLPIENTIWSNLASLTILGVSISLALLPTFEAILDFALESGFKDELSTYGIIAGIWSSMYSLGEVTGPTLGGLLLEQFGFPVCSTVMAAICFAMALIVLVYFLMFYAGMSQSSEGLPLSSETSREKKFDASDSGISENEKESRSTSLTSLSQSQQDVNIDENTPLLAAPFSCIRRQRHLSEHLCDKDQNNIKYMNGFDLSSSFPEILKTVSLTGQGAVEV